MSQLHYAGSKKITRLPRRSAIVAFSADEVYAIAELIRRQRGAAAVVLGSLSPRTRNAQVALYQSGDVDFLVATDAIGMGLNLDVDHVAFAQDTKFDGTHQRRLKPAEFAQIAGRAGRHTSDGTFGVTSRVVPFEDELVERLESHEFPPEKQLQWRNRELDFASITALTTSLEKPATGPHLVKAPMAVDHRALVTMAGHADIRDMASSEEAVFRLWQVAQIPDYRRIAPGNHADMLATIYRDISMDGVIDESWFANQVGQTDNMSGDIDALSNRIAHIRTWTFVSHRDGWLRDGPHWREKTRAIEDRLSDALHERLTKRFVDRRTSVLMKRLRENAELNAEIAKNGDVMVEGHHVGVLNGFRFTPDATVEGTDAKASRAAAQKALAGEFDARANRLGAAANADIASGSDAVIRWNGAPIGKLVGTEDVLAPRVVLLADEQLTGVARDKVQARLDRWIGHQIDLHAKPLRDLATAQGVEGLARGVAFRLLENLGTVERKDVASDIRGLEQDARAGLRRLGVRFGFYHVFVPALLKPAPAGLVMLLWAVKNDRLDADGVGEVLAALAAGRTSFPAIDGVEDTVYRLGGYRRMGAKAVRIDMLERLADMIRPAAQWRHDPAKPAKRPEGAWDGQGFMATAPMLSILGATHDDMAVILRELGYRGESMLEADVVDKLAQWDRKGDGLTPEPKVDSLQLKAETPEPDAVSPAGSVMPNAENAPSSAESGQQTAVASPEPEAEPKRVDIWRQQRTDRPARQNRDRKPARNDKPKRGETRPEKPRETPPVRRTKPAPKPIDPDNPFAALAGLKKRTVERVQEGQMSEDEPAPSQPSADLRPNRVDKWLFFARIVKSRTIAQNLVRNGRLRVNGNRIASPSASCKHGDVLTVALDRQVKVLKVLAPGDRRGPAPEAQTLYEDLTPPAVRPDPARRPMKQAVRDEGAGRPSKRERRDLNRLRGDDLSGDR